MKILTIVFVFCFLTLSCSQSDKQVETNLKTAVEYFLPLNDYRSVTCEIGLNLPESFKALKRQELIGSELESWNTLFNKVEQHVFRWSTAGTTCWVRGMRSLKKDFALQGQQEQFLDSLDAQIKVGSCVLLQAFFYNSPFEDLRMEDYDLSALSNDQKEEGQGFALTSYNKKSEIHWHQEKRILKSRSASGEQLRAEYQNGSNQPLLQRASIKSGETKGGETGGHRSLQIEGIKFESRPQQNRQLVSELQISLQTGEARAVPQARLQFQHCVSRIANSNLKPSSEAEF